MKAYAGSVRGFKRFPTKDRDAANIILDSAVAESRHMNYQFLSNDPRIMLAYGLSSVGGRRFYDLSQAYVKQLSLNEQSSIVLRWIMGIAESGNYWEAYASIPDISILTNRLSLYNLILLEEANRTVTDPEWKGYLVKRKRSYYQEDFQYETNPI